MDLTTICQKVLDALDDAVEKLSPSEYVDVLEELSSDIEIRLLAAREEAEEDSE